MINSLAFINDQWVWPVAIAAILLLAVFLWKELAQAGKRRFVLKAVLAILAILALALIALKPALPTEETTGKMVLLTEGYQPEKLDSLKKENRRLKEVQYTPGKPFSKDLSSAENVFVLGYGLKEYDLWQLDEVPAIFLEGIAAGGVVKLKYEQEQRVGESLRLMGMYKNPESGNQLFLQGPGGIVLDSMALNTEEEQQFQLTTDLKVAGNYVYSLVEKDSMGKILSSDPVPVKVAEKNDFKILIVNSFPTFETKYLKNFLAEAGHELVIRSQITRGRFKFEYFNTDRIAVNNLSETTLEAFDLLIIDAATIRTLSGNRITAIETTIRNSGLGLFIQADDAFFNSTGKLYPLQFTRVAATEITTAQWSGIKFTRFPYEIREDFSLQQIQSSGNSIASAYKRIGQGKIGTTVFLDSWQLILDGKIEVYRELWSQVVEQIGKKQNPVAEWQQESMMAYNDEPFNFQIRTGADSPKLKMNTENVSLVQHPDFPEVWSGTVWPRETGWNSIELDSAATFDYYAGDEKNWNSLNALSTQLANNAYFKRPIATGLGQNPLESINPFWFFIVFLICIGVLWLEPKL
jgi:hypothetical protein